MNIEVVEGNLLDQAVDVIVNPWNRNIIPWWLLLPQGVSGAIKKCAGYGPFWQLGRFGPIPLGGAVQTTSGHLSFKAIIHVAGINMFWRASERSIHDSVVNSIRLLKDMNLSSIAFPIIGSGSGGFSKEQAERIMIKALKEIDCDIDVIIVRYKK